MVILLRTISQRKNYHHIVVGNVYIAAIGSNITILERETMEVVHNFAGISAPRSGVFLGDETLAVFTGEQKILFMDIPKKQITWRCPRFRQLASCGDMKCCRMGDATILACIAQGKSSLNEHFLLLADYKKQTVSIHLIPNCNRVVSGLVWTPELGLTFLSYQAKGDGLLCYSIAKIDSSGNTCELMSFTDHRDIAGYTGRKLFFAEYCNDQSALWMHRFLCESGKYIIDTGIRMNTKIGYITSPFDTGKVYLPKISWIDEKEKLMTLILDNWLGVFHLQDNTVLLQKEIQNLSCSAVIEKHLLVGCSNGLFWE